MITLQGRTDRPAVPDLAALMRRIGVIGTDFPKLAGRDRVLVRTEQAVRALYDQLWDTAPLAATRWERATRSRALSFAAARGWAPPMAWDDATIDDPAAHPAGALHPQPHHVAENPSSTAHRPKSRR